jgi:hypothetical protein
VDESDRAELHRAHRRDVFEDSLVFWTIGGDEGRTSSAVTRMPDRGNEPAAAPSLVTASVEEAFDLGVADVLFILQGADVVADERVDAVSESACGFTER